MYGKIMIVLRFLLACPGTCRLSHSKYESYGNLKVSKVMGDPKLWSKLLVMKFWGIDGEKGSQPV